MIVTRGKNKALQIDIPAQKSPTGKRIRCSAKTTDMEKAKELETQLLKQYISLERLEKEAQREHFDHLVDARGHTRMGAELILMLGASTDISLIDESTIRQLTLDLQEKGNQQSTINGKLSHLSMALKLAVDWGYLQSIPNIKFSSVSNKQELIVNKETELNIIQALLDVDALKPDQKWKEAAELVAVLFDTGAKLSEVLKLKAYQVNFDDNTLTLSSRNNHSSKARTIQMTERVASILKDRNCHWTLTKSEASSRWRSVVKDLGIYEKEMVLQVCRRTCSNRLIAGGMGIYEVSQWLGVSVMSIERYGYSLTQHLNRGAMILQDCNS